MYLIDYKNLSWVWGANRKIRPKVTVCKQWSRQGWIFLSAPNNNDRYFFLSTFWSAVFDFNVRVAFNESRSCTLTSAILKVDNLRDVAMTSAPSVLMTKLRDLIYNHCIDNTLFFIFTYPTGRIRACTIRFVSIGENRGKPCLVCNTTIGP